MAGTTIAKKTIVGDFTMLTEGRETERRHEHAEQTNRGWW